jgi:hypothetical protein
MVLTRATCCCGIDNQELSIGAVKKKVIEIAIKKGSTVS